jgi:hypothetical protein
MPVVRASGPTNKGRNAISSPGRGKRPNAIDVRGYRAIFYEDTIVDKKQVERTLDQHQVLR